MDGAAEANIEDRRQVLTRILAGLVAMAGLAGHFWAGAPTGERAKKTLPRRLRNAVLRLLRPAEAAARRLAVALAQKLVVTLPPPRPRRPKRLARRRFMPTMPAPPRPADLGPKTLPPADPPRRFAVRRASRCGVPVISFGERRPVPKKPEADDPCDAARLLRRLAALGAALADLPGTARRVALWQARRAWAAGARGARPSPLRRGRPPGFRRHAPHEVDDVLAFTQALALHALSDTS